jgi:hypothetical protein
LEPESERIERHIEETRRHLGQNIDEIEDRVRTTLDWRTHYYRNPALCLGVVCGATAAMTAWLSAPRSHNGQRTLNPRVAGVWDKVKDAGLALATRRLSAFLDDVLPGFGGTYRGESR